MKQGQVLLIYLTEWTVIGKYQRVKESKKIVCLVIFIELNRATQLFDIKLEGGERDANNTGTPNQGPEVNLFSKAYFKHFW